MMLEDSGGTGGETAVGVTAAVGDLTLRANSGLVVNACTPEARIGCWPAVGDAEPRAREPLPTGRGVVLAVTTLAVAM